MNVDDSEFVSLCYTVIDMVESLDDTIIGPSQDASFNSISTFDEDSIQSTGSSFVFGINCGRNGVVYTIIGSPQHDYFEIIFSHDLMQSVITQTALTETEQSELSQDEQAEKIETADITQEEVAEVLASNRKASLDIIESRVYSELGSQTGCSFNITRTEKDDIIGIESIQKVFVNDDDFTRSDLENAIVSVTNVGKSSIFLLSELYDIDSVSPTSLSDLRGR